MGSRATRTGLRSAGPTGPGRSPQQSRGWWASVGSACLLLVVWVLGWTGLHVFLGLVSVSQRLRRLVGLPAPYLRDR